MKRAEYFFAYFNKKNINKLLAGLLAGLCNGLFGSDEAVAGWLDAVGCCTVVGV